MVRRVLKVFRGRLALAAGVGAVARQVIRALQVPQEVVERVLLAIQALGFSAERGRLLSQ